MDGLQAAVLSAKLKFLPAWTKTRRSLASRYREELAGIVRGFQACPSTMEHVYHLFTVEVSARDDVQRGMAERGIGTAVQYAVPLPLLEAYTRLNHRAEDFPIASALTRRILSLPLYPELTAGQQREVVTAVSAEVARANRHLANA